MNVYFYSPISFEKWDFRSPDDQGIGGSETAVSELAWRLAKRGYDVTVYAPLRDDCPPIDIRGGAKWLPLEKADFSKPGFWFLSRCPEVLDNFPDRHTGQTLVEMTDRGGGWTLPESKVVTGKQKTFLICQDVFYPPKLDVGLKPERSAKLDICLPLCTAHEKYMLEVSPELAGKTIISSNGIRVDLIKEIERENSCIDRDPYKLIYASSPDRGLITLLKMFRRAKEIEPRLKLTCMYGFNNIDKCEGQYWQNVRKDFDELINQPDVTWLGRIPQKQLYKEFLSAGLWVYPSDFTETSCITCMQAQALGAIPITNPLWALSDNVRYGIFIEGDINDKLTFCKYTYEILRLTGDLQLQEKIRSEMMLWARSQFDWERIVDQYEGFFEKEKDMNSYIKVVDNIDDYKSSANWSMPKIVHTYSPNVDKNHNYIPETKIGTVKWLIEELSKLPPDLPVVTDDTENDLQLVRNVVLFEKEPTWDESYCNIPSKYRKDNVQEKCIFLN